MEDSAPKKPAISFYCIRKKGGCGSRFTSVDYRTEPDPDQDWHPYRHWAVCPKCGEDVAPASHQVAAWKAAATPRSVDARAAMSAAQRARDPASYAVSRFNAITHGATAETAKFYPARPGHYPICEACEYFNDGCGIAFQHCAKRTELFVQFHLAQESGDGSLLGRLMASTQAGLMAITNDMIRDVAVRGVALETPVFTKGEKGIELATYEDAEGRTKTLTKVEAHPLLLPLINIIQRNTMTLGDMGLTPKAKEKTQQFKGFLDAQAADRETLQDATRTQQGLIADLFRVVGQARVVEGGRVIDGEIDDAG
ncbi:MAG: hypothetical protein BWK73_37840 [Thiothrix lacustris]|uniref:Uncharacterized protein n=1 Tax=Thiothrix lacustris TaxID=525917 RepID=A0A1Y1QEN0_9GAMM|nr:MAG: hypothetical protein BWK73_37840 [Thiothrix lacustris]